MAENSVSLYECLYGMELFKKRFVSKDALANCMKKLVSKYRECHEKGEVLGPVDFNEITLELETGDITNIKPILPEAAAESINIIKFLPPEIINHDTEFGEIQDRYCMAVLLFAIRYFSHPFDGKEVHKMPVAALETAKRIYGEPTFVFDVVDSKNSVVNAADSNLIRLWSSEPNEKLKDLFTTCFTVGIHNYDMRPDDAEWYEAIGGKKDRNGANGAEQLYMEIDGKIIKLSDGLKIFEHDLYEDRHSDRQIGVVLTSKKSECILALGNVSNDTWSVYMPDSREIMVAPNNVAPLVKGSAISIGDTLLNIITGEEVNEPCHH